MAQKINDVYNSYFDEYTLSERFINVSLKKFLKYLPFEDVADSMHIACSKINNSSRSIKYFCGICWKKIKSKTDE